MEVERVYREWDVEMRWAPFLLDPSIPPEGRVRTPQTTGDTPKSNLELMGERRNITFSRGRTFTPHSHLALELGEYSHDHGDAEQVLALHRALFKANFTDFENISEAEVLARIAGEQGFDAADVLRALTEGRYRDQVDAGIENSYAIGVTAIPTFVFNNKYAVVGAQEYETFERVLTQLGAKRRDGTGGGGPQDLSDFS